MMIKLKYILWLLVLVGFQSVSAQTIKSFDFSRDFYTIEENGKSIKIYAGSTAVTCPSTNDVSTCDTCSAWSANLDGAAGSSPGFFCNKNQVYPTLKFRVSFTMGENFPTGCASSPTFTAFSGTNQLATAVTNVGTSSATVEIAWSAICGTLGASTNTDCRESFAPKEFSIGLNKDCSSSTAATGDTLKFTIGLRSVENSTETTFGCDSNVYNGVCKFTVYPGDEKVYIKNIGKSSSSLPAGDQSSGTQAAPSAADASGFKFSAIRVYYQKGSTFSGITAQSSSSDLKFDSSGNLANGGKVTGLDNDVVYTFLIANVDQAGNVSLHTDPSSSAAMSATAGYGTTQAAKPEKVYGLLDGKNCFIATAAYGNADAGDVESLRQFRNRYLLSHKWGQKFVETYYKFSPPVAHFIAQHEWLRSATWLVLQPLVWGAEFLLNQGNDDQIQQKIKRVQK